MSGSEKGANSQGLNYVQKIGLLGTLALGVVGVDLIGEQDIREAKLALTELEGGALLRKHLEGTRIARLVSHYLISLLHLCLLEVEEAVAGVLHWI